MERILSLNEARVGYRPRVRHPPNERAKVLPGDPDWLHSGLTMRLTLKGKSVDFFTVSARACALNRLVRSVRRLEAEGRLPVTPFRPPGRSRAGQKRLYTRGQVLAVARVAEEHGIRKAKRTDGWDALAYALTRAMTVSVWPGADVPTPMNGGDTTTLG